MKSVFLQLGFYAEMPHNDSVSNDAELRLRSFEMVKKINKLLDTYHISRTFFLLGDYLNKSLKTESSRVMKDVFQVDNPLVDIQQHGYAHKPYMEISDMPGVKPVRGDELLMDLCKAERLMRFRLEAEVIGLGTPFCYEDGLRHAPKDVIEAIMKTGIEYISSDHDTQLIGKKGLRQPYMINDNLMEIPSHGWEDSAFIMPEEGVPETIEDITSHYFNLMTQAREEMNNRMQDIYISLCMHPWAMAEYDKDLEVLDKIIEFSISRKIKVQSYTDAYIHMTR